MEWENVIRSLRGDQYRFDKDIINHAQNIQNTNDEEEISQFQDSISRSVTEIAKRTLGIKMIEDYFWNERDTLDINNKTFPTFYESVLDDSVQGSYLNYGNDDWYKEIDKYVYDTETQEEAKERFLLNNGVDFDE